MNVTMSKVSYYTEEGLKKLREELNQLKDVERPKASQAIAEARDKGDLSENAEYDAAKEAQGLLEMKISKMEEVLANARVIDESQLDTSKALVLSKVKIKNQLNGQEMQYTLVAESIRLLRRRSEVRASRAAIRDNGVALKASRRKSPTSEAVPSPVFKATLPVNPSVTMTSTLLPGISPPSTKPTYSKPPRPAARAISSSARCNSARPL